MQFWYDSNNYVLDALSEPVRKFVTETMKSVNQSGDFDEHHYSPPPLSISQLDDTTILNRTLNATLQQNAVACYPEKGWKQSSA